MARVFPADLLHHVADRQRRFFEQLLRTPHPHRMKVAQRRGADRAPEQVSEARWRQAGDRGELVDGERAGYPLFHRVERARDPIVDRRTHAGITTKPPATCLDRSSMIANISSMSAPACGARYGTVPASDRACMKLVIVEVKRPSLVCDAEALVTGPEETEAIGAGGATGRLGSGKGRGRLSIRCRLNWSQQPAHNCAARR